MNKKIRLALILSFVLTLICALFIYGTSRLVKPIGFENVKENEIISGDKKVVAWMQGNNHQYMDVALEVDGEMESVNGEAENLFQNSDWIVAFLQKIGLKNSHTVMQLNTNSFANGEHKLTLKDAKGNSASRRVLFSNGFSKIDYDSLFVPRGSKEDDSPKSCRITAVSDFPSCVVEVSEAVNPPKVIRSFQVASKQINLVWDGKDEQGNLVPANQYYISFRAGGAPSVETMTNLMDPLTNSSPAAPVAPKQK